MDDIATQVNKALADPETVLARLALYESAERKGRHIEYDMSILRYALTGYLTGAVIIPDKFDKGVECFDDAVKISGTLHSGSEKKRAQQSWSAEVEYPAWLASFFEDEATFDLLRPGNETSLTESLALLREWVEVASWIDALPQTTDVTAETSEEKADQIIEEIFDEPADDVIEDESDDDEWEDEAEGMGHDTAVDAEPEDLSRI